MTQAIDAISSKAPTDFHTARVPRFTDPDAARVWNYWFAHRATALSLEPAADPYADDYVLDHGLWFHGGAALDDEIRRGFEALVDRAARGEPDGWAQSPRECVALVVLLDQFPRNMYRGTARAFAHDARGLDVARRALARGFERQLAPAEAVFLYLALTHSEDAADVREALAGITALITRCAHGQQRTANGWRVGTLKHLHVLERFGRYPHRNAALGRTDSALEKAFLERPEFSAAFMRSQRPAQPEARASSAPRVVAARVAPARRLRILALHGFRQNAAVFRARTRKMRRALADLADFTFVTSPMHYAPQGDTRTATLEAFDELPDYPMQQVWWLASEDNESYQGFDASVAFLEEVFRTQGPFDGVMGFAQGGTLAALLAALQPRRSIAFRFAICVSSFPSRAREHAAWVRPGAVTVPALHVLGTHDILVTPDRSRALFASFDPGNSVLVEHAGGHFVPGAWPYDAFRDFAERFVDRSAPPAPAPGAAPSDALYRVACEALAADALDLALLKSVFAEMAGQQQWRELAAVAERAHALRTARDREAPEASDRVAVHEAIVGVFARQLARDLHALNEGAGDARYPSLCARATPRIGAHVDKACHLARDIACELFAPEDMAAEIAAMERERVARAIEAGVEAPARRAAKQALDPRAQARRLSYQRFGQALSRLRGAIQSMDPAYAAAQTSRLRKARAFTPDLIEQRRADPISTHVAEPRPEPVVPCTAADLDPLLTYLRSNASVETQTAFSKGTMTTDGRLDLCKQVVGPEGIHPLLAAMMHTDRVKRLLLGNNIVGDGGAQAIAGFIRERRDSPLECWYIAGNHIGPAGLAHVCDALARDTRVTSLWLKRNPLKAAGMASLAAMLRTNRTLEVLDVVNCGLLDEGLAELLGAFSGPGANTTLRHLYLGTNGVTERSAPLLARFVAEHCALESLYLSCNRLGDDGVEVLARALAGNRTLRRVSLASNRVGARGAAALATALTDHPTIALLDLGFTKATVAVGELGNFVGDEGARVLAQMLAQNTALRSLNLLHNYVSQVGVNHLREALAVNRTLTSLQLTQFGRVHNEPGKEEIRAALARNRARVPAHEVDAVAKLELPDHVTEIYSVYRTHA